MWSFVRAWSVVAFASVVVAQRIDQEAVMAPRSARVRDRDLTKTDEPTCDQLKAMWRFSKRQARAPEIMNEVSNFRDPFMYNEWPAYTAIPRVAPRFRYQYTTMPRETYGRVVTKAPPNVVRTPDYDEMFGMLNPRHTSGKVLRFPGPSRTRAPSPQFMVPPQRDSFEALKKMIRAEHVRELHRKYEAEQKQQELKELATGHAEDYVYGTNGEQEPRGLQPLPVEYSAEEPNARHMKKPPAGSRQVSQFNRYSDVMLPPSRRSYRPYFEYAEPDPVNYHFY